MRVGWLHDDPGYLGGAELTMQEFKAAAPEDVVVVDCRPGDVKAGMDRYVAGNLMTYAPDEVPISSVRYHHDINRAPADRGLVGRHLFCSPLQRERMDMVGECIPPAIDLEPYEAIANSNHRRGAVCIGRMAYGKGVELLAEYGEQVDVYSTVSIAGAGNIRYRGPAKDVPATLAKYERFVFLPTAIEPFGRAVVEAWAAGLELVVNKNVGALHWIENEPDRLRTAAKDFWAYVLD